MQKYLRSFLLYIFPILVLIGGSYFYAVSEIQPEEEIKIIEVNTKEAIKEVNSSQKKISNFDLFNDFFLMELPFYQLQKSRRINYMHELIEECKISSLSEIEEKGILSFNNLEEAKQLSKELNEGQEMAKNIAFIAFVFLLFVGMIFLNKIKDVHYRNLFQYYFTLFFIFSLILRFINSNQWEFFSSQLALC